MTHSEQRSRREWFRLIQPARNPKNNFLDSATRIDGSEVMVPVEQPPNHDGLDLSQLPPMREAMLQADQVKQLFSDIGKLATDVMLMVRRESARRATASRLTAIEQLQLAQDSLLNGHTRRIQIRYRWQDSMWIDTLDSRQDGIRLVRIAHQNLSSRTAQ